jgi:hypothetical protein
MGERLGAGIILQVSSFIKYLIFIDILKIMSERIVKDTNNFYLVQYDVGVI